jgi:hypothetical protein
MKAQNIAAVAVLLLSAQLASAYVDLSQECQGNLLINGGFEEPNTEQKATQLPDPTSNSKWGWYEEIPGMWVSKKCHVRPAAAAVAVVLHSTEGQQHTCKNPLLQLV